jgi:protocatechuate 4,5-dioxygenase beta chain
MARIIGGLGAPHAPSIGAAIDRGQTGEPAWKPLFDGFVPMRAWLATHQPDVLIVFYNDHFSSLFLDNWPTFAISVAGEHRIADEGWGARPLPPVPGDSAFAWHLAHSLVEAEFDLAISHDLPLDHGCLTPLSALTDWQPRWPVRVVPIQVNVLQFPLPTARRCFKLGRAVRAAVTAYAPDLKVAVLGTGGLSHQLGGERFGFINPAWDMEFLERLESDPESLAALRHQDYLERGGTDGIEEIMWLCMRGALAPRVRRIHRNYYHATLTGYGQIVLEDDLSS